MQVYRDGHQMAPPSQIGTQPPLQSYMGAVDGAQSPMGVVSPRQSVALNPVLRQQSYDTMFQAPYQPPSVYPQQQVPPPCHTHMYYGAQPTYGYVPQGHAPYTHQYSDGYIQPPPPPRPVVSTSQSVGEHWVLLTYSVHVHRNVLVHMYKRCVHNTISVGCCRNRL